MKKHVLHQDLSAEALFGVSFVSLFITLCASLTPFFVKGANFDGFWEVILAMAYIPFFIFSLQTIGLVSLGLGVVRLLADVKKSKVSGTALFLLGGIFVLILLPYLLRY